jgi:hypothetical protein
MKSQLIKPVNPEQRPNVLETLAAPPPPPPNKEICNHRWLVCTRLKMYRGFTFKDSHIIGPINYVCDIVRICTDY